MSIRTLHGINFSKRRNKMSIKDVSDTMAKVLKNKKDENLRVELFEKTEDFERLSSMARDFLLERMEEKDFVRFMLVVQKAVLASMLSEGDFSLLLADQGSLQPYTHTVVLTVIGALIEDEIL
jgi:hypothetical protein